LEGLEREVTCSPRKKVTEKPKFPVWLAYGIGTSLKRVAIIRIPVFIKVD